MPWVIGNSINTSDQASLKSARAGRASRAGARAGRIVRLVRMVKLYKYYSSKDEELNATVDSRDKSGSSTGKKAKAKAKAKAEQDEFIEELEYESHVGAAMSDITTRRVIVLVLVMLIIIPLLSYSNVDGSAAFGSHVFHRMVKANISSPGAYSVSFEPLIVSLYLIYSFIY